MLLIVVRLRPDAELGEKKRESRGIDSELERCGPEQQSVFGLLSLLSKQDRSSRQTRLDRLTEQ